jgi:hypothetical protein
MGPAPHVPCTLYMQHTRLTFSSCIQTISGDECITVLFVVQLPHPTVQIFNRLVSRCLVMYKLQFIIKNANHTGNITSATPCLCWTQYQQEADDITSSFHVASVTCHALQQTHRPRQGAILVKMPVTKALPTPSHESDYFPYWYTTQLWGGNRKFLPTPYQLQGTGQYAIERTTNLIIYCEYIWA